MVSATECNAKPVPMETDKKSLKTLIKSFFHKKKEKAKHIKGEPLQSECQHEETKENQHKNDDVAIIVSKIENINIKDQPHIDRVTKEEKSINSKEKSHIDRVLNEDKDEEPDELDNFCFKVIDEPRNERIHSHSSSDSGFSEKSENVDKINKFDKNDKSDDAEHSNKTENEKKTEAKIDISQKKTHKTDKVKKIEPKVDICVEHYLEPETKDEKCEVLAEKLEKLELDSKKLKPTILRTVFLKRSPLRTKLSNYTPSTNPYPTKETESLRQINKHTLTGGQVIVNKCQTTDNLSEINIACENLQQKTQYLQTDREGYLEDVLELIREETSTRIQNGCLAVDAKITVPIFSTEQKLHDYMLAELEHQTIGQDEILQLLKESNYEIPQTDAIEVIVNDDNFKKDMYDYIQTELNSMPSNTYLATCSYPTPPRSENQVPSPMSASPSSFYPSNSEYILSPERSPISNSDYERYQYVSFDEERETIDISRHRSISTSSMTMKQFKDMQKEIVQVFSKRECCQINRKSCLELFQESMQKLKLEERKYVCVKVATMDLKAGYGVLHHIMLSLSRGSEIEDLELVLFSMICERALDQDINMFVGDLGLSLLKAAALRCPHKPLLTRYLVQCIRKAVRSNASLSAGPEYAFNEVDPLGDTLVIACARAGDRYSDVLYELVRAEPNDMPLFKMHHTNTDGHTALHVACSQHSASSPRLHTVHVLLEHGGFELTEGDSKGGDTALHLAVNSTNCDIQLILMMFKHVDRKEWKNLAHCPNLSSKTPLDLARLATKSTSRPNYPPEVLDFLKKCR